jgi:DnaJ-class molecular chaperone
MPDSDWQAEIVRMQERDRKARALLGVSEIDSEEEIRQAFRRASLAHHPDLHGTDAGASRRFHLVCCAYRCLTEGEACTALDELDAPARRNRNGKYRLGNPWGYWCWWRESYLGGLA